MPEKDAWFPLWHCGGPPSACAPLTPVPRSPPQLRKLTAIYYLNPDWAASHEGAIRLFHGAAGPPTAVPAGGTDGAGLHAQQPDSLYTDLFPCGDRLLLFASDVLVHEVLPSYHAHRCAGGAQAVAAPPRTRPSASAGTARRAGRRHRLRCHRLVPQWEPGFESFATVA